MHSLIGGLVGSLFFLGQVLVGESVQGYVDAERMFKAGFPGDCAEVTQTMSAEECHRGCGNAGQLPCYIVSCMCGPDTPGLWH
jgi:hypothetical protein